MSKWIRYPRARLDLYEEAIVLTRCEGDDRHTSYPVAVDDLVAAFSRVPISSGLLPANCLFWGRENGQIRMAIYVPGRRWQLRTAERIFHVPLPPLVFVGSGNAYQIYAAKWRPQAMPFELFHCPTPNVHPDGAVCQGSAPFPVCASDTIEQALSLFLEGSLFNDDLAGGKCRRFPDDVRKLWTQLDGAKRFPIGELVPVRTALDFAL
ncbi:MAG: hypothetical protein RRC07_17075 [Anaerolineae bacterium]|nr:hypothetical protein [Anaerolineae bacterium]